MWRTLYIFPFLFRDLHIQCTSVLYHSWLFLSDKSQIVNMPSLRKNINTVVPMASPSRQIGGFLFVTNFNNNNHLKLFLHSESRGNMKTLTLSLALHSICLCPVLWCVLHIGHHCTEEHSHHTRSGEGRAWGDAAQNMVPSYTTF